MKKRMVLADLDSEYLNHIAGYFMEHAPQLEQNLFTKSEKLRTYLERGKQYIIQQILCFLIFFYNCISFFRLHG